MALDSALVMKLTDSLRDFAHELKELRRVTEQNRDLLKEIRDARSSGADDSFDDEDEDEEDEAPAQAANPFEHVLKSVGDRMMRGLNGKKADAGPAPKE